MNKIVTAAGLLREEEPPTGAGLWAVFVAERAMTKACLSYPEVEGQVSCGPSFHLY
jgi:hypothetical protein